VSSSRLVGVNGSALQSVVWLAECGQVAYPLEHLLVLEDLRTHEQRVLGHHTQQVGGWGSAPHWRPRQQARCRRARPASCLLTRGGLPG
jgi:hypothetical protein